MALGEAAGPSTAGGSGDKGEDDRKLRSNIRNLAKKITREGDDIIRDQGKLRGCLDEANAYHGQVENPREQAEEVDCFFLLAQKGAEAARMAMGGNRDKTANDLIRALKAVYVTTSNPQEDGANIPTAFNWLTLARVAGTFFKHAPGVSCMLGPMDAAPKVRKVGVRQPKKALGALVIAADIESTEQKEEADKNMEEMWAKLLQDNGKNVLQCVMNHVSFSQTVENMFALSFLVRDGRVTMTKAAGGGFNVTALSQEDAKQLGRGQQRTQAIFGLTMDRWDTWRRLVRPEDCIMDHRPPAPLPGAAGASPPPAAAANGGESAAARKRAASTEPAAGGDSESEPSENEEAARALNAKGKRRMRLA